MAKSKGRNVDIITISLEPETLEALDKVVEIGEYDNRSTMIEKAITEFLIREVVKYGKIYSG